MNKKKAFKSAVYQIFCIVLGLVVISPILYCVLISFMEPAEILTKEMCIRDRRWRMRTRFWFQPK